MSVQEIPEEIGTLAPEVQATYDEAVRLSDKIVVDGKLDSAITDETFEIVNPAWLNVIGSSPRCREADVDRAVGVAKKAFKSWSRVTAKERGALMSKLADIIEEHADDIARLEALETGNAYSTQARPELNMAIEVLRMFAGFATELKGNTVPWVNGTLHYTTRDPLGVVAAIIPWNAPILLWASKIAPAIVAGNTVVLKTAEQAPLAVLKCTELAQQALPAGVVNTISGIGEECGRPLAEHKDVRKITFTGSCPVGRQIMHYAADKICPVTLELGGKSPNIVMPDADMDLAIPGVIQGMRFSRQGQSCTAGSRLFLHKDVADEVIERVIASVKSLKLGDPMDPESEIGTIISQEQFDRVTRYVELARNTPGAEILCGGGRPDNPELQKGLFFAPTLIKHVPHESACAQEEIFGPVAVVFEWDDFATMMDRANDTEYGLAATLWTRDLSHAMRFVDEIEAGLVQVNQYGTPIANVAYGGLNQSGLGKELSLESMLEHFTRSRTVIINQGTPDPAINV
jgi:acyl-CoA reductase-like NAD-dependent aldehyde dehydrogenase